MEHEFESQLAARLGMAGNRDAGERSTFLSAADAASTARANILATSDPAPTAEPEFAPTRNTEHETRNTNSWPITRPNIPGAEPGESPLMTVFRQARTEIGGWGTQSERADFTPHPTGSTFDPAASLLTGRRRSSDVILEPYGVAVTYVNAPSFDREGKKPITGEPHGGSAESVECEQLRRQAEQSGSAVDWADYYLRCRGIMYDPGLGGYGNLPIPTPQPVQPEVPRQPFAAPVCLCKFPCFKPDWEPRWKGAPEGNTEQGRTIPLGRTLYAEFQLHQSSLKPEDICTVRAFPSGRVKLVEGHISEADVAQAKGTQELPEKKMRCPSSRPITIIPVTQGPAKIVAAWGGLVCTLDLTIGPPEKCGCEISCAELAADGTVLRTAKGECELVIDFSDPKTTAHTGLALALDLVGEKGANTTWSLYSRDFPPLVEFTKDVSAGANSKRVVVDPHAAYDVPIEDESAECGQRVWIHVRPTDTAVNTLYWADPDKPIKARLVAVVGKKRCPIEIVIKPYCDEDAHKAAIGKHEIPEIRFAPLETRHGSVRAGAHSDNSEVARIYSNLKPGFSDGHGYRVEG